MKKDFGMLVVLVILCAVVAFINPRFLSPANLQNTARLVGLFGLFSLGVGLVIITGGIDLSVGSVFAFLGVLLCLLLVRWHVPWPLAVMAVVGLGVLIGLLHGVLVAKVGLQPFIVTLCGLLVYRGAARFMAEDSTLGLGYSEGFERLAWLATGTVFGVPLPFIYLLLAGAAAWVLLHRSVFGRHLLAVGRNEEASRFSGIDTARVTITAYLLCGLLAGVSSILLAFYATAIAPSSHGNFYELYGIAAAVLGGCSLRGGEGSVIGILLGTVLLQVLQNLVNLLGIPSSLNFAVMGAVILAGVLLDRLLTQRATVRAHSVLRATPIGVVLALGICLPQLALRAEVRLPAIISENMVLQADVPNRIWGKAEPGESVEVAFAGQSVKTQADAKGAWAVELAPLKASSENSSLVVIGKNRIEVKNVLVGEVWLGSGQSNMEWNIGRGLDPEVESAKADYPAIRHFEVSKEIASAPTENCQGKWEVCSPKTVKGFSAVLYHFGRSLHAARQFPVGLINASQGASYIHAWMSREALASQTVPSQFKVNKEFANLKEYNQFRLEEFGRITLPDTPTWDERWAQPGTATAEWKEIQMPQTLEKAFGEQFDGASWTRREFVVPDPWVGKEVVVKLPQMSSGAVIYWNGEKLSSVPAIPALHEPSAKVPAKLVKPGANLIALRFFDPLGTGGPQVEKNLYLQGPGGERVPLDGKWLGKIERRLVPVKTAQLPPQQYGVPSGHYNAMIVPLHNYRCRGVLWYQGESDSGNPHYGKMLEAMIQSWRQERNDPALAFFWVQLPNFGPRSPQPIDHAWGLMRKLQSQPLKLPHTGMAVTIDSKQPELWHPTDKRFIGERLALLARNSCYGENELEASGPRLERVTKTEGGLLLSFSCKSGLQLNEGEPNGFALSADGKSYHWAKAQVEGSQIRLSSAEVKTPRFVRYAWDTHPYVSLFSKGGLPAAPFEAEAKD